MIGDNTGIAHACTFIVGKRIQIGSNCLIAEGVLVYGSSGHPTDIAGVKPIYLRPMRKSATW